jgi:hypothetical protein
MLNAIKKRILLKEEFLESASIIFEDAVNSIDDYIFLEDSDTEEIPETDKTDIEETIEDDSPEELSMDEEDPSTVKFDDIPLDDGESMDDSVSSDGNSNEEDDFLSVSIDLKTNTINDILPVPPNGAGEAINDDVLNTRIDSGFDDESVGDITQNTIEDNPEENVDEDELLSAKIDDGSVSESVESEQVKKKAEEIVDNSKKNIEDMKEIGDKSKDILKDDKEKDSKEYKEGMSKFDELTSRVKANSKKLEQVHNTLSEHFQDSDFKEKYSDINFDYDIEDSTKVSDDYISEDWKDTLKSVGGAIKKGAQKASNILKLNKSLRNLQMMDLPENFIVNSSSLPLIGNDATLPLNSVGLENTSIEVDDNDNYMIENRFTDYFKKGKDTVTGHVKQGIENISDYFKMRKENIVTIAKAFIPTVPEAEVLQAIENFKKKFNIEILFVTNEYKDSSFLYKLVSRINMNTPALMQKVDKDELEYVLKNNNSPENPAHERDLGINSRIHIIRYPRDIIAVYPQWLSKFNIKTGAHMETILKHEYGHVMTYDKLSDEDWKQYAQDVKNGKDFLAIAVTLTGNLKSMNSHYHVKCYWQLKPEKLANEYSNINPREMAKAGFGEDSLDPRYDDIKFEKAIPLWRRIVKENSNTSMLSASVISTRDALLEIFPSRYHLKIKMLYNPKVWSSKLADKIMGNKPQSLENKQRLGEFQIALSNVAKAKQKWEEEKLNKNESTENSFLDDFLSEAISIDGASANTGGEEAAPDTASIEEVPYDDENTVTKAVKSKVDEANNDTTPTEDVPLSGEEPLSGGKEELIKKLGNITKSLEDAKRAILDNLS